jgi:hypothetical protein
MSTSLKVGPKIQHGKRIHVSINDDERNSLINRLNKLPSYQRNLSKINEDETGNINSNNHRKMLSNEGPLSHWTDEEPVPWDEWYALNNIETEVME